MTDDSARPEVLVSGGAEEPYDDSPDDAWRHPATLAVVAVVLAVLSLMGASALRGAAYASVLSGQVDPERGDVYASTHRVVVWGAVLSTLFAVLPVVVARLGLSRLVPDDPAWSGHLLRAALLLGALSALLHALLVVAAVTTSANAPGLSFLLTG